MPMVTERDARRRVRELVWRLKGEIGNGFSPRYHGVDDPVARHLDIRVKEQKVYYGTGGVYVPGERPEIVIDPDSGGQERLNFTYFHELCHHLIREDGELYGFIDDYSPKDLHTALEHYCNIGAAEFLVPEAEIRAIIGEQGFSIELVHDLDTIYPASKPAIAIQIAECAPHQCIVLICEYGILPLRNGRQIALDRITVNPSPQLFVRYSSSSPSCKYRTARFVAIPKNHFLLDVYEGRNVSKGHDRIPFQSETKWSVDCEGFFYTGKVYAVFHVTPPPSRAQMALNI